MDIALTRKSLQRRISWFGGDRRIVGGSGFLLVMLGVVMFRGFGVFYGLSFAIPAMIWFLVIWLARALFKADPYMVDVLLRLPKYRKYYAPKAHLDVEHPQVSDYA